MTLIRVRIVVNGKKLLLKIHAADLTTNRVITMVNFILSVNFNSLSAKIIDLFLLLMKTPVTNKYFQTFTQSCNKGLITLYFGANMEG